MRQDPSLRLNQDLRTGPLNPQPPLPPKPDERPRAFSRRQGTREDGGSQSNKYLVAGDFEDSFLLKGGDRIAIPHKRENRYIDVFFIVL